MGRCSAWDEDGKDAKERCFPRNPEMRRRGKARERKRGSRPESRVGDVPVTIRIVSNNSTLQESSWTVYSYLGHDTPGTYVIGNGTIRIISFVPIQNVDRSICRWFCFSVLFLFAQAILFLSLKKYFLQSLVFMQLFFIVYSILISLLLLFYY